MRYDEEKGIYRDCRFCGGRGCLACPAEAEKAYKKEFPNGPTPIAIFRTDNPGDMEKAKKTVGAEAITKAFGPDGNGVSGIIQNLIENKCYAGENT